MDRALYDLIAQVCHAITERGREHWWLQQDVARAFESLGYHLLPRHFYSPVPDPDTIAQHVWNKETFPLGRLRFDDDAMRETFRAWASYAGEIERLPASPRSPSDAYFWDNPFFTGMDAVALYGLIRHQRPAQVVEIGSGFSTQLTCRALRANATGRVTCIEPYPSPALLALGDDIELLSMSVQSAPLELFQSLSAGDVLFIDSSHVSALDSDVNREIFELLPSLAEGVFVHVHDIFFPFDYPAVFLDQRRWYWNEQYVLYAFLLMNHGFEVVLPVQHLIWNRWDEVERTLRDFTHPLRGGTSLWLRRIAPR